MYRPARGRSIRVSGRQSAERKPRRPARRGAGALVLALACVAVAGTVLTILLTQPQKPQGSDATLGNKVIISDKTIYEGVFVEDLPLGGLTREQAKEKILAYQEEFAKTRGVAVTKDAMKVSFTITELPHTFDTEATVAEAWAQGRTGTEAECRAAIAALMTEPVKLKLNVTVDTAPLEAKIREMAEPYEVTPMDAKFVSYDATRPEGQRLTFTSDIQGSRVDDDALWAAVKKEFDDRTFGTVEMTVTPVEARVKLADLQGNMQLIGECDTYLRNHTKERYTNIKLASEAIHGMILAPGQVFSFNDTVGERTPARGYKDAPVDNQGVEDVGIGGGICQVSGTLFNACMRANLEIVERHHHSIPSAYLKKGRDATVDWGKYDLKIKNSYDKPVLLILHFGTGEGNDQYNLYAEIFGQPYPQGVKEYDLETKIKKTIPPKDGYRTVKSKNAEPGSQTVIDAHPGYVIEVYKKTVMADGTVKLSDEPLYTDTYAADCKVIVFYYEDDKPTGLPTASPSPTPKPSPTPEAPATPAPTDAPAA